MLNGTNVLLFIVYEILWLVPYYYIFRKAKYHSAWALLSLVPVVGPLACAFILAFTTWPLRSKIVKTYQ